MGFADRLGQASTMVTILNERVWKRLEEYLTIVAYGYENYAGEDIRGMLRYRRTQTAKHIRFTPDFFVIDRKKPLVDVNSVYLLDYKVTRTPLYSKNRINTVRRENNNPNLDWQDIGQMEEDAYDNYMALHKLGIRIAILDYCAYHPRPLLYDFVENITLLHRDTVTFRGGGSGTPFINFDCNSMRSLDVFLSEEHKINMSKGDYESICNELQAQLPVAHDPNSPLHPNNKRKQRQ